MRGGMYRLIFLFSILLVSVIAVAAEDVAYVLRNPNYPDDNYLEVFDELELSVDFINDNDVRDVDFSQYGMIFVEEGAKKLKNVEHIPVGDMPSIVANMWHPPDWGLTLDVSQVGASAPLEVELLDGTIHDAYTSCCSRDTVSLPIYYMNKVNRAPDFESIAFVIVGDFEAMNNEKKGGVQLLPVGARLVDGRINQGELCFFGITETNYWTSTPKNLFRECVLYVKGEDRIPECQDEIDNDLDGAIDYPDDFGCESLEDDSEVNDGDTQCSDGLDNDNDGYIDQDDPMCDDRDDDDEFAECNDSIDNDFDNAIDLDDFSCSDVNDDDETNPKADCQDGRDNDGDGLIDLDDPGCDNNQDDDETNEVIICEDNSDCDDLDSNTEDICHNPGETDSFCTNDPIGCFVDSDCGDDGFVGVTFCEDIDVVQEFVSYTCLDPGTGSSSCTSDSEDRLIEECSDACVEGVCVEIACYVDSDCFDGNPDTEDTCYNPGTIDSFCFHGEIECNSDVDCGIDVFTGDLFCSDDDIEQNFLDYNCENPGTLESYCTLSSNPVQRNSCDYACINNGACVRCDEDLDCDDLNSESIDECILAGTLESYCSNIVPICENDLDCDDSNHLTIDTCVNPGEASAFCNNAEINCASELDCGNDGFVGEEFCVADDVFKKFVNYTCVNEGTTSSFCEVDKEDTLVTPCDFGCFEGECTEGVHDIGLDKTLGNSMDGIKLEFSDGTDILDDRLLSGLKYKVVVKVENDGDFIEDVDFIGQIRDDLDQVVLSFEHNPISGLEPGDDTTKTKTVNITLDPGFYTLSVETVIPIDNDLSNNKGERLIEMFGITSVPECQDGIDNDFDGAIDYPDDFGCESLEDDSEINEGIYECSDGIDNDGDILIDQDDPGCDEWMDDDETDDVIICYNDLDCDDWDDLTIDECVNPGTVESFCKNTPIDCNDNLDCGTDGFFGDSFCIADDVFQDFVTHTCLDPGTLDANCVEDTNPVLVEQCADTCVEGECVGITCYSNADCDDLDPDTEDICHLPGTVDSFCTNDPIECFVDSDCGDDGFLGEEFCVADDVHQNFVTYDCNNPGTSNSFCSNSVDDILIEACFDTCFEGECVVITCREDLDCGETGFVGDEFCIGDDIYQDFMTNMCLAAGTIDALCDQTVDQVLVDQCNFACNDGECIECDEDLDCDDLDPTTIDMCLSPGTEESYCVNEKTECDDGIDNDGDGFIDWPADLGCDSKSDNDESPFNLAECDDGIDNDRDGFIDWPLDPGCESRLDNSELPFNIPECDDGRDNDGDGLIDWPLDPQCYSRLDNDESQ